MFPFGLFACDYQKKKTFSLLTLLLPCCRNCPARRTHPIPCVPRWANKPIFQSPFPHLPVNSGRRHPRMRAILSGLTKRTKSTTGALCCWHGISFGAPKKCWHEDCVVLPPSSIFLVRQGTPRFSGSLEKQLRKPGTGRWIPFDREGS